MTYCMTNLISAQFSRLFKSKWFYLSLIFFIGYAMYMVIPGFMYFNDELEFHLNPFAGFNIQFPLEPAPWLNETLKSSDFIDFIYNIYLGADYAMKSSFTFYIAVTALLVSLLIGREFGNSTVRNKLIVGYSRTSIYTANLIVCSAAGIIMQIVYVLAVTVPTIVLYIRYKAAGCNAYLFNYTFKENATFQLAGILIIIVYTSLFLLLTMLSASQTRAVLASLLAVIVMILMGEVADQTLYASYSPGSGASLFVDYAAEYELLDEKEAMRGSELSGAKLFAYETMDDILTNRQVYYITASSVSTWEEYPNLPIRIGLYILYDIVLIIVINILGIFIFNRKELK